MVRDGHSDSARAEAAGFDGGAVDDEALAGALELVARLVAVVAVSFAASFAACARMQHGRLHRSSRQRVHLRRGAPIAGIAWAHCSIQRRVVQMGCCALL
jgi:hypothetical protein